MFQKPIMQKCVSRWWQYILNLSVKKEDEYVLTIKGNYGMDHVLSSGKFNNSTVHINAKSVMLYMIENT